MIDIKEIIQYTKHMTLLYVEDNKDTRVATLGILNNLFDNIIVGIDGQDGLDKFKDNKDIDLVISDINMPKLNGINMSEQILIIDPNMAIFIFSAHNESNYFLDAIELGIEGYFLKPLNINQFLKSLTKYIQRINFEKSRKELANLQQEKEKVKLIFEMVKNISHHWKQPLTVISTISSGYTFKKELGIDLNDEDFDDMEQITKEVINLSDILKKLETLNFETISLDEIQDIINISSPLYNN